MRLQDFIAKCNPRVVAWLSSRDTVGEMAIAGVHSEGIRLTGARADFAVMRSDGIDFATARLVKDMLLDIDADAAIDESVWSGVETDTPVIIAASRRQYKDLLQKLAEAGGKAALLSEALAACLDNFYRSDFSISLGGTSLAIKSNAPLVMGILNVTPDSFSDGGDFLDPGTAVDHALEMAGHGADIIDIGGESTRPGSLSVSADEEMARVIPVVRAVAAKVSTPISIDTSKPEVARAALDEGAAIINDITALSDDRMRRLAAERACPVVLMHMKGSPRTMQKSPFYRDIMGEITLFLRRRIEEAVSAGVEREQLIVDPGIGFGKTVKHNLDILRRLKVLASLGRPILVGASRKSFLGTLTGALAPDRTAATAAANALAVAAGAHAVRVHDVAQARQSVAVASAIQAGQGRGTAT